MRAALESSAALIAEGLYVSEVVPVPRPLPCLVDVTARARSRSGDGASGDGASGTDRDGGEGQLKCFVLHCVWRSTASVNGLRFPRRNHIAFASRQ